MSAPQVLLTPAVDSLHPAFDVRENVLTLGFSVEKPDGREPVRLQVLNTGQRPEAVQASQDATRVVVGGKTLHYRRSSGLLPSLDEQWSREHLNEFLKTPRSLPGQELYRRLVDAWSQHVEFDHRGEYVILACWAVMTYVYPLFSSVPFIHLLGPKSTGKSQALDVMAQLARLGYKSQQTAPVIGDMIQMWRITPLLDQVDFLTPAHVDLLTDSYRVGARRAVTNMDDRSRPHVFETFGPKAFAGTTYLNPDLADRVILISATPATRNLEPVVPGDVELSLLRCECYAWALLNFWKLPPLIDMMLQAQDSALVNAEYRALRLYRGRQRDLWLPIEVVMEALGVPPEDRDAARDYYDRSQAATKAELREDHVELLELLHGLVGSEETFDIRSSRVLEQLSEEEDENGRPVWNGQKLGLALKSLNVLKSKNRTTKHDERRYVIDGRAVRSLVERY